MAFNSSMFTDEEQKTLHWDGIVAVCTGKFKNLTEAKESLSQQMLHQKSLEYSVTDMATAIHAGGSWGDIWFDDTWAEMNQTKKELRKTYVELVMASETPGYWRIQAKKTALEERLISLKKDLGMTEA